jgi:hypothetical protein
MPLLPYLQGNTPWYLLDKRLGGHQRQSGHYGEKKNFLHLLGIKPCLLSSPDCSLDPILTELEQNYHTGCDAM